MFWRCGGGSRRLTGSSQRALVALVAAYLGRKPSDAELVEDVVRELEQRAGVGERAA
jgi:hypothetical protein